MKQRGVLSSALFPLTAKNGPLPSASGPLTAKRWVCRLLCHPLTAKNPPTPKKAPLEKKPTAAHSIISSPLAPAPEKKVRVPRRAAATLSPAATSLSPAPTGDLSPQLSLSSTHGWTAPKNPSPCLPRFHPPMDGWGRICSGDDDAGSAPTCGGCYTSSAMGSTPFSRWVTTHHIGACCCGGPRCRRISDGLHDLDAQDPTPLPSTTTATGTARRWRTNLDTHKMGCQE